jgi:hypothetical protein
LIFYKHYLQAAPDAGCCSQKETEKYETNFSLFQLKASSTSFIKNLTYWERYEIRQRSPEMIRRLIISLNKSPIEPRISSAARCKLDRERDVTPRGRVMKMKKLLICVVALLLLAAKSP